MPAAVVAFREGHMTNHLEVADLMAENARLRKVGHDAFMAMCAHRDSPDDEVFQEAIDALGLAVSQSHSETP